MRTLLRSIMTRPPCIEWFLDIVYLVTIVSSVIALVYGTLVLIMGWEITLFGLLWAFVTYCGATYVIVRTYTVIRKLRKYD